MSLKRAALTERRGVQTRACRKGWARVAGASLAVFVAIPGAAWAGRMPDPFGPNAKVDYQLGGAYPPAADVTIVTRDRTEPSAGRFDICYINGFQGQATERAWWERKHPNLLLRDRNNAAVVDPNWDEAILDISTPAKRRQLTAIFEGWVKGCAQAGYEAVEFDNLDTYTRFPKRLSQANAVDMAKRLIVVAERAGLQVGQKNAVELLGHRLRFDFAVTESCAFYDECEPYLATYGGRVIMIEYDQASFGRSCSEHRGRVILLADRNLARRGAPDHLRTYC